MEILPTKIRQLYDFESKYTNTFPTLELKRIS